MMAGRIIIKNQTIELLKNETVLSALLRMKHPVLFACEEGYCHSCMLRTNSVIPDEVQLGLSEELKSSGAFLACKWKPNHAVEVFFPGEEVIPRRSR